MLQVHRRKMKTKVEDSDDDDEDEDEDDEKDSKTKAVKGPKFYEIKQGHSLKSLTQADRDPNAKKRVKSFADRLQTEGSSSHESRSSFGNLEMKYIPKQGVSTFFPSFSYLPSI